MATKDIPGSFTDGSVTASDDGGNSATLPRFAGDFTLAGYVPNGRAADVAQAQGATVGIRDGERVYPTLTFSGILADLDDPFHRLCAGKTAGYVNVAVDIGDHPCVDITFDGSYKTDTRTIVAEDCHLTEWSPAQGSPASTGSFTVEVLGPLTIDGTVYIDSR